MKLICVNTSTQAFDDHRIDLKGDGMDIQLRVKSREDFDIIKKGDEVEINISGVAVKATKPKKAKAVKAETV